MVAGAAFAGGSSEAAAAAAVGASPVAAEAAVAAEEEAADFDRLFVTLPSPPFGAADFVDVLVVAGAASGVPVAAASDCGASDVPAGAGAEGCAPTDVFDLFSRSFAKVPSLPGP